MFCLWFHHLPMNGPLDQIQNFHTISNSVSVVMYYKSIRTLIQLGPLFRYGSEAGIIDRVWLNTGFHKFLCPFKFSPCVDPGNLLFTLDYLYSDFLSVSGVLRTVRSFTNLNLRLGSIQSALSLLCTKYSINPTSVPCAPPPGNL